MSKKYEAVSFQTFKQALQAQFAFMQTLGNLFIVDVEKDALYDLYQDSFPEGTNLMYKERREYDCNCCKSFIRSAGRVVAIQNNKLVSIWDVQVGGYYQVVVDAMKEIVEGSRITDRFFRDEDSCGTDRNVAINPDGSPKLDANGRTKTWDHFYVKLPQDVVIKNGSISAKLGELRSQKDVLFRALTELDISAGEIVSDLIAQGSLYRGSEFTHSVETFLRLKTEFDKLSTEAEKLNFTWVQAGKLGDAAKFRNHAIGTLLIDLSEGKELEDAVKAWEAVMAPTNYKRPTALVTPAMISAAQAKIEELGMIDSLPRRFAVETDLTINNVLFADRSSNIRDNSVFAEMISESTKPKKKLDKVEEISIADFIANVLPGAKGLEVFVGNEHQSNLVSLVAPVNASAPNMLLWDNNFSWSYNGEVTDSIKERVKSAGGSVSGDMRVSLSWSNPDDLDLYVTEPSGHQIYFGDPESIRTGGNLDVDMNAYGQKDDHHPVENITWPNADTIARGEYVVVVNNYNKRLKDRVGFTVQVEYKGQIYDFHHAADLGNGKRTEVVRFKFDGQGIEIGKSIGHTKQSREAWGLKTENFHKVKMVMNSPNFWDDQTVGNKHVFFMLDGCLNPTGTRGFYNEYLRSDLGRDHRKVFEVLAGKMKVEASDNQLSGVGFSVSQRNELIVKVHGAFDRLVKIKF